MSSSFAGKPSLSLVPPIVLATLVAYLVFAIYTPVEAYAVDHGNPIPEFTWYGNDKSLNDGAGPTDDGVTASATIYEDGCLVFETANGSKSTGLPGGNEGYDSQSYVKYLPWSGKTSDDVTKAMEAITSVEFGLGVRPSVLSFYFQNCPNLQYVATLPASVGALERTFSGCTSLLEPPLIPESLEGCNMKAAFFGCTSMTVLPKGFRLPHDIDDSTFAVGVGLTSAIPLETYCSISDHDALKDFAWATYGRELKGVGSVTIELGAHTVSTGGRLSQVCPTEMKEINVAPESGLVLAEPKVVGKGVTVTPLRNGSYNISGEPLDDVLITFDDAKARIPFAEQELVYNGKEQAGVVAGAGYEVAGGSATDAGSYVATATALQGYVFTNDETSIELPWFIAPAKVAIPTAETGLFYTGSELTGVAAGEGYTVEGGSATDAGGYTATVTVDGNHVFTNGDTSAKVAWAIMKAPSAIALADQELTYTGSAIAYSGPIARTGSTGAVTFAYFSDPDCAASIDASQVVEVGTYYVKAMLEEDSNHWGATSNVVSLSIVSVPPDGPASGNLAVTAKTIKAKASKLKKKAIKVEANKVFEVEAAPGKVTYQRVSISCKKRLAKQAKAKIKVAKSGKVTLKKGLKKGTYRVKVMASAVADGTHDAATKTITLKIVVK